MQIRVATVADAAQIARVHVETWQLAFRQIMPADMLDALDVERRAAFWAEQLSQSIGETFVAEIDATVAGFCQIVPTRNSDADPARTDEIVLMYVHPRHGRQGIGRALWQRAFAETKQRGCTMVTLWVLSANVNARRFYESVGFAWDGTTGTYRLPSGDEMEKLRYRLSL